MATLMQPPAQTSEFEVVSGLDPATVKLKRVYEAQVEAKVASDYQHIVWAYGIIWALFAAYGWVLWRRARAQLRDSMALAARIGT